MRDLGLTATFLICLSLALMVFRDSPTETVAAQKKQIEDSDDFMIRAIQKLLDQLAEDFELTDQLESELVFINATHKNKAIKKNAKSTVSIVLFRPSSSNRKSGKYKKKFDTGFELRFSRIVSDTIKSPMAVITTATRTNHGFDLEERSLRYTNHKWQDFLEDEESRKGD